MSKFKILVSILGIIAVFALAMSVSSIAKATTESCNQEFTYTGSSDCVVDLCSNLDGNQENIPTGYEDPNEDRICAPIETPTDLCPNVDEIQTEVPEGLIVDESGNCVRPEEEIDICLNIEGIQTVIPTGFKADKEGVCKRIVNNHKKETPPVVQPQILGESVEELPVGGGDILLYESLLIAFVLLIGSAIISPYLRKIA